MVFKSGEQSEDHIRGVSVSPKEERASLVLLQAYGGDLFCIKIIVIVSINWCSFKQLVRKSLINLQYLIALIVTPSGTLFVPIFLSPMMDP